MRRVLSSIILILLFSLSFSQTLLTPQQAVEITLENNYQIKIDKNAVETAENNTSKLNNRYLPTLDAAAGGNLDLGSSTQQFGNGSENKVRNAFSNGANASLTANYTIFDQTRSTTLAQLRETLNLVDLQLRQTMELQLLQLFNTYYQVARLTANLEVQAQTLEVSKKRLQRAQYQFEYGQGIRLDVLNAQVDVQRDSINFLNIKRDLKNSQRDLNFIMGRPVNTSVAVDTAVRYAQNFTLGTLYEQAKQQNIGILIAAKNLDVTQFDLQRIAAERKPRVTTNASYTYSFQDNASGAFIDLSTSTGLGVGVNVSWNIYDGGVRKIREQNTLLTLKSQGIQKDLQLEQLGRDLNNAWESYQNALYVLEAEEANLSTNRLNFARTETQYQQGQTTSVEFRQAQLNLLNAATNYNNAKFDAKVLELELYQLSGGLMGRKF